MFGIHSTFYREMSGENPKCPAKGVRLSGEAHTNFAYSAVWFDCWLWWNDFEPQDMTRFSPAERRLTRGTKWFSKSDGECWAAIVRSESTALSRTTVSSTVARDSKGGCKCNIILKTFKEYYDRARDTILVNKVTNLYTCSQPFNLEK